MIHNDYQDLKVYREDEMGLKKLYDARGITAEEQDQSGRHRMVPIGISPGSQFRLYIYVRSMGATQYPLSLLPLKEYLLFETNLLSVTYLTIGSLCVMMVLSFAFGWIFRDVALIYYGLSILLATVVNASVQELPEQWFGPMSHALLQHGLFVCMALSQVTFTLFTRLQMMSSGSHPFYPKLFKVLAWTAVLCPLATMLVLPLHQQRQVMLFLLVVTAIFWLVAGIHNSLRKQRVAMIYLSGMIIYLISALSQILNKTGVFSGALLTDNMQTWGLLVSLVLLLVSLSSRFSAHTRLTLAAQRKALSYEQSAHKSQAQLLELERKINESLERQVVERTLALEGAIKVADLAKSEAEEANLQKARFLAAASHDIRQPLQALSLLSETLLYDCLHQESCHQISENGQQGGKLAEEVLTTGHHIRTSVGNLVQLIDMLFDLSKLDNKLVQPTLTSVDLHHCVSELSQSFRPLCQKKGVELALEISEVGLFIQSDTVLLQRILHILVDNALKHARCRQIRIEVSEQDEHYLLVVADDGIGIAESEQENVFEEFYQLKNPERNAREGMGMGLALCQRLVLLLGYQLSLDSALGAGARFELKMDSLKSFVYVDQKIDQTVALASQINFSSMKVLVVEDDAQACHALVTLLEKWGVDCRFAHHSADSLQLLQSGWIPNLALLDYRLPDSEDGFQLAAQLRKLLGDQLAVLIFTGDTDIVSPGIDLPVLHKPLRASVLRVAITNQLLRLNKAEPA